MAQNQELINTQNEIIERDKELRIREEKHLFILDESDDPIFTIDNTLHYTYANKATGTLVQRNHEELPGLTVNDLYPPEDAAIRRDATLKALSTGETVYLETSSPHDRNRFFLTSIKPIKDINDNYSSVICISKNISTQKHIETSISRSDCHHKKIIENAPFGIHLYHTDDNGRLIFDKFNPAANTILGVDNSMFIGKPIEDVLSGFSMNDIIGKCVETARTGAPSVYRNIYTDYNGITASFIFHIFQPDQGSIAVFFSVSNEDDSIPTEENERVFFATFYLSAVGISHITPDGSFIRINPKFCEITGYSEKELLNKKFTDITHQDDIDSNIVLFDRITSGETKNVSFEKRYIRKDGNIVWIEMSLSSFRNQYGDCRYIIAVIIDITELKMTEKRLCDMQKNYALVSENTEDVIWLYDIQEDRFPYVSPSVFKLTGYTPDELSHQTMKTALSDSSYERLSSLIQDRHNSIISGNTTDRFFTTVVEQIHKNGSVIQTEISTTLITDDDNRIIQILGVSRDITERLATELNLRKSSYLLERAQDIAKIGYWEIDLTTRTMWASRGAKAIYGIDVAKMPLAEIQTIPLPEYRRSLDEELKQLITEDKPYDIVFKIRRKSDGVIIDIRSMAEYDRKLKKVFGVIQDITSRIKTEESLRQSELRYKKISSIILDYIYTVTIIDGVPVSTTHAPGCISVTGYSSEEFAADPFLWVRMVAPEDRIRVEKNARMLAEGQKTGTFEHRIYRKDGSLRWVRNTPVLHYSSDGILESYDGLIQDITEKKMIEDALKESESKYRGLVENMHDVLWRIDPDLNFTYISPTIRQFGFTPGDMIGKSFLDFVEPDTLPFQVSTGEIIKKKPIKYSFPETSFIIAQKKKDGTIAWLEVNSNPIYDDAGSLSGYQGVSRDVTERKAMQEALATALSEKESLLHELNHRVKNSLAMIAGLVGLEMNRTDIPTTRDTLHNLHTRITTIANLYDILIAKNEETDIRLDAYLKKIVGSLSSSYISDTAAIVIDTELSKSIIDMKRAATVGLILNELLTNALKYAFPEKKGTVVVALSENDSEYSISVRDNGKGLPEAFDLANSTGLGSKLVLMLSHQLGGSVRAESGAMTSFTVTFPK
jgi:PAS domain S-box-containing protein